MRSPMTIGPTNAREAVGRIEVDRCQAPEVRVTQARGEPLVPGTGGPKKNAGPDQPEGSSEPARRDYVCAPAGVKGEETVRGTALG